MGQQEILKYLEYEKEKTIREIAEGLNKSRNSVTIILRKLRSQGLVERRLKRVGKYWLSFWRLC